MNALLEILTTLLVTSVNCEEPYIFNNNRKGIDSVIHNVLKLSGIEDNPLIIGAIAAGGLVVIIVFVFCLCRKKEDEEVKKEEEEIVIEDKIKKEEENQIKINTQPPANNNNEIIKKSGSRDETMDKSNRNLISIIDKKENILAKKQNDFNEKLEVNEHEMIKNDLHEVYINEDGKDNIVINSKESRLSKVSYNKEANPNVIDILNYSVEIRETPSNSFYKDKKEEIQHVIDLAENESYYNNDFKGVSKKISIKYEAKSKYAVGDEIGELDNDAEYKLEKNSKSIKKTGEEEKVTIAREATSK